MSSWSGWIVATMSRIGPDLGRSISWIRILLVAVACGAGPNCSSSNAVRSPPATQIQSHRIGLARAVERPGYWRPPVDHDRRAVRVVHVPAANMKMFPGRVIESAKEQRGVRQVTQGFGPAIQVPLQVFLGNAVTAHSFHRQDVLSHPVKEIS